MKLVLVIGGAGFIGSHLVKKFLEKGFQVAVIDNLISGRLENLSPFLADIEFIKGSILEDDKLDQAMLGADYVLHHAALPSVPRSLNQPLLSLENNITITLKILEKARQVKIKKLVYASSSSVYGGQTAKVKSENLAPDPLSPYAVYKSAGEKLCQIYSRLFGLKTVCLRYFNVFGPNQDPNSAYSAVIPLFIKAILNNQPPIINGQAEIARDFTFVENNAEANWQALVSDQVGSGEVINIATGQAVTLGELVDQINNLTGRQVVPTIGPKRPGDIMNSLADIFLAKQLIGYRPKIDFVTGLRKTVEYYRQA